MMSTHDDFRSDSNGKIDEILAKLPASQRPAAANLIALYGPKLLDIAKEDATQYIRRLLAGDIEAATDLYDTLTHDEFLAQVTLNTQRWAEVAEYNIARAKMRLDFGMKAALVLLAILMALVGL